MKHCISLEAFSAEEVRAIVLAALELKRHPERFRHLLEGRWLLMLFQKTSTRTRLSFEVGMGNLGGRSVMMEWDKTNFAISPIAYEARYASGAVDLIMARLIRHSDVQTLARNARVPVINGCDEKFHPCQALADLMTVYEQAGRFEGQTLTYVGIHNNVANSLALACTHLGVRLNLVTPEANPGAEDAALMARLTATGLVRRTLDLQAAARESQFVYTDTWVDMEHFAEESYRAEKERRIALMMPYQLNRETLAGSAAHVMHDMPVHPGYEIAEELIDSPRSLIYTQAENRLYSSQALMLHLLGVPVPPA
jgi:ornithine carbamoyltransferase